MPRTRGRPPKSGERRKCSKPDHSDRAVWFDGIFRESENRHYKRFRCSPGEEDSHIFYVRVLPEVPAKTKPEQPPTLSPARPHLPPEPCPEHPTGQVRRDGTYEAGGARRQRYLCIPAGWVEGATRKTDPEHAKHRFTPVLPRTHVEGSSTCPHCEELRAVNHGETVVARKHSADTRLVAEALGKLGHGDGYADVGLWIQEKVRKGGKSAESRNAWRRAADIVEVFAPVLWNDWLENLTPLTTDTPRVVLLDDLPVFGKATRRTSQRQRFSVLALGEVVFNPRPGRASEVRLRALRALPEHSTGAYKLLLDELDYTPDFVVADGGKGIAPAVEALRERTGADITFVTSVYHLRLRLNKRLDKIVKTFPGFAPGELRSRVDTYDCLSSRAAWEQWLEDLERRLAAQQVPKSAWPHRWKQEYFNTVCTQLDAVAPWPNIPRSTGGLEDKIARFVKPSIKRRGSGFGNLPRTNQLLDLFVLRANGYFNDPSRAVAALRKDAVSGDPEHPGFVPLVRQLSDPGMYRSLLDSGNVDALVENRGL